MSSAGGKGSEGKGREGSEGGVKAGHKFLDYGEEK